MARQKSVEDIFAQQNRILGLVNPGNKASYERYRQALRIGDGYISNIQRSKSFRNATKGPYTSDPDGDWKESRDYDKANNRKYSKRIYMGLSKG